MHRSAGQSGKETDQQVALAPKTSGTIRIEPTDCAVFSDHIALNRLMGSLRWLVFLTWRW